MLTPGILTPGRRVSQSVRLEPGPKLFENSRLALVALGLEGLLEIGLEAAAELHIRLGSGDDLVELGTHDGKLLSGADPRLGSRRECTDQPCEALFVEGCHRELDGVEGAVLPSSCSRSLPRQREMRLAIVPAGSSRASPIVR